MLRGFALLAGIIAMFKVGNEERQKEYNEKQWEIMNEKLKESQREQQARAIQTAEQKEAEFRRQQKKIAPMFDGYEVPREIIEEIILKSRTAEQKREWKPEYMDYLDDFQRHIKITRGYSVYNPLVWSFGQDKVSRSKNSGDIFLCSEIERNRDKYSSDYSSDPLRVWYAVLGEIRHNESVFNFDYTGINWYDKKPSKFINYYCKDKDDMFLITPPTVCTRESDFLVMFICESVKYFYNYVFTWDQQWNKENLGKELRTVGQILDGFFSTDSKYFELLDAYGFFVPQKSVEFMKRWNKKEEDFIESYV